MGKSAEPIAGVPCGNIVGLAGIDQYLKKTGTISDHEDAFKIRDMKYAVSPVYKVAIEPKNPTDLPKFLDGLSKLMKYEALVEVTREESGQHFISGSGELHVEVCLKDLEREYAKCEIKRSFPVVSYRETVSETSQVCFATSVNKHNRLYCFAQPLQEGLPEVIESEGLGNNDISRAKRLCDEFEWDKEDAFKIWTFGPERNGPNILVNMTKEVKGIKDIKEACESAFTWATKEGVLCGEEMRQVRMNLADVNLHADATHRGAAQIVPTARRVYSACQLSGQPRLQEPFFLAEIIAPSQVLGGVYECLSQRRGIVFEEAPVNGTPLSQIKAYLPVIESYGFNSLLRSLTSGQAFPQCIFSHWAQLESDPLDLSSKAHEVVRTIRKTKGLTEEIPSLETFMDKI